MGIDSAASAITLGRQSHVRRCPADDQRRSGLGSFDDHKTSQGERWFVRRFGFSAGPFPQNTPCSGMRSTLDLGNFATNCCLHYPLLLQN